MGGKPLNAEMYEKIITDRLVFGVPAVKIAKDIERTPSTISCIVTAFESVRDENWDQCEQIIDVYKAPLTLFNWAANKLGKEIPPSLEIAYEKRKAKKREYDLQKKQQIDQQTPAQESAPEAESPPKQKAEDNTGIYFIKLLEAVNKQNELLEQLYDVVIPKWTGDLKDNLNVNSDMVNQSLKRIDDKLEAIKINVRKRGL